jgi:hypothetical protein
MGNVTHFGFMSYLLGAVLLFLVIALVNPDIANDILLWISELSKAVQGIN